MDIIDFLERRIAEDELRAREALEALPIQDSRLLITEEHRVTATGWRTLAEAVLKRDMLFVHHDFPDVEGGSFRIECITCQEPWPCHQLRFTAAVCSDYPRYDSSWAPHNPDTRAD